MKINNIFRISLFLFAGMFYSCEKVIDLNLNTSSSQIVIQGNVYDLPGPYTVRLSKSVGFGQLNSFPAVTGATVTISDDAGNSEVLSGNSTGVYVTSKLQGMPGRTYILKVESGGQAYTSSSTIPNAVEIDTLYIDKSNFENYKQLTFLFNDPASTKNYYRLIDFINDTKQNAIMTASDLGYDGKTITGTLLYSNDDLKSGDTLTIWFESVDKGVYDYFRTASTSNGQDASPANPVSNISNGALGYFNACSVRKKVLLIP